MIYLSWDKTFYDVDLSLDTIWRAPILYPYRPIFLAKDWEIIIWNPWSRKYLIGQASFSRSPVANPWYAESKYGIKLFFFITLAICFHYYSVGSTPVGLWAQACKSTIDPAIAFYKNFSIAGILDPNVFELK